LQLLRRLLQGPALSPAIWGLERKASDGTLSHSGLALMNWVVGNVKVEVKGNGNVVTKQTAGRAKIDPFVAAMSVLQSRRLVRRSAACVGKGRRPLGAKAENGAAYRARLRESSEASVTHWV